MSPPQDQIVSYPIFAGLARWTDPGRPDRAGCVSRLNGFAVDTAPYTNGSRFCVRTQGNRHYAFIEFVGRTEGGWKVQVTVWPGDV